MADAPEKIWIQRPCRDPESDWFGDITWSDSKENDDDTEYIRSDLAMDALGRKGVIIQEFAAVTRELKRALIKHRERLFPGTDQEAVIEREYPAPNLNSTTPHDA